MKRSFTTVVLIIICLAGGYVFSAAFAQGGGGETVGKITQYVTVVRENPMPLELGETVNRAVHFNHEYYTSVTVEEYWAISVPATGFFSAVRTCDPDDLVSMALCNSDRDYISSLNRGMNVLIEAGEYLLRCRTDQDMEYSLTANCTPFTGDIEPEPDSIYEPFPLALDTPTIGTMGMYHYDEKYLDDRDYWKISINEKTRLMCTVEDASFSIFRMYWLKGREMIEVPVQKIETNTIQADLSPGEYVIEMIGGSNALYPEYVVTARRMASPVIWDVEPNDTLQRAMPVMPDQIVVGDVGYRTLNRTDEDDFYRIVTDAPWDTLFVTLIGAPMLEAACDIHGADGGWIGRYYMNEENTVRMVSDEPLEGPIYVNVKWLSGEGAYRFVASADGSVSPEVWLFPPREVDAGFSDALGGMTVHWEPPADMTGITGFTIYRSRCATLAGVLDIGQFPTAEAVYVAEAEHLLRLGTVSADEQLYVDPNPMMSNVPYYYWVVANGDRTVSVHERSGAVKGEVVSVADTAPPETFHVDAPFPNPFNPATTIRFSVAEAGRVSLVIYDVAGRRVRTLVDGEMTPGIHEAVWNGTNDAGQVVGSGLYLFRLGNGARQVSGKLTFLR